MRNRVAIRLEPEDRARLESLVAGRNTPQKQVYRARIVLLTADGVGTMEITRRTGQSKPTVWRWQERFVTAGVDGLLCDATRPPGKKPLAATLVKQVVEMTLHQKPPGATHWTSRSMARSAGIGVSSVQRIWRAHGLKPPLVKTFKLSNDPRFVEKLRDVVGLYISPPERALVLSVDEKTQIQALDRTQPGLPMKKGRAGTMTHDYKRHGTTTLFAALNILDGTVIGRCMQRPRLPRSTFHFTPTSCSWLNAVETFFAALTKRRLKRGVFRSVVDLQAAINRYLDEANHDPKPFIWTADPDKIIAAVNRGRQALDSIHEPFN